LILRTRRVVRTWRRKLRSPPFVAVYRVEVALRDEGEKEEIRFLRDFVAESLCDELIGKTSGSSG
jgi:hypothetical protein